MLRESLIWKMDQHLRYPLTKQALARKEFITKNFFTKKLLKIVLLLVLVVRPLLNLLLPPSVAHWVFTILIFYIGFTTDFRDSNNSNKDSKQN